jgi:radical SAM enzyme (TIGR01210 family)
MCDLWKNTLTEGAPPGAIAAQIRDALAGLAPARRVKLYNAGSFFDPRAIPAGDFEEIAETVAGFERVIVEAHPALVGSDCLRLRDLVAGRLEVAIGLETVDADVLPRLNKRMTLARFDEAAAFLAREGVALRVFVLAGLPFVDEAEGLEAARRSIAHAFDVGATAVSVIPTRAGNGALDELASRGEFTEPSLAVLEAAVDFGLGLRRGRVFADLWDLPRFGRCAACFERRAERLAAQNLLQRPLPRAGCAVCGGRA